MSLEFIKAGLQTTIQDLGRIGHRKYGIANSGAIDPLSLKLANYLASKPEDSPCFEITMTGPIIKFQQAMSIGIAGANFDLFLNDISIRKDQTIHVNKNDILRFGKLNSGCRAYLALSGNLAISKILNSYSTNLIAGLGGYGGRAIRSGDVIKVKQANLEPIMQVPPEYNIEYTHKFIVRTFKGIDFSLLDKESQNCFFNHEHQVSSEHNRMGIRLIGKNLQLAQKKEIISSAIVPGTVQLPPNGQPIITLNDGQTIGGYPRIANILSTDMHLLGQMKAKDTIRFFAI